MTSTTGYQEEVAEQQRFYANPRTWTLVIAPYDAEAVYILATASSKGADQKSECTANSGTDAVWNGSVDFSFWVGPDGDNQREVTMSASGAYGKTMTFNASDSVGHIVRSYARLEDFVGVEGSEWETVVHTADYSVYSPHGKIDLPEDGYWPTLFPESVLEGTFIDQQPVRALFSYTGDGLYFTEEGSPADKGGYPVGAPGIMAFFIGGA
jgi:hypothetical protein